jgi:transposase
MNWPPFRPDTRRNLEGLEAILKHRLMSDDYQRIELISGSVRRRQWTTEQKLQNIEESFQPGETVSSVARRRGVAPNLLYRWRRLMTEGGAAAVGSDEPVARSSEVRRLEERVRELERMLGRKTMEVEILREALAKSESKKPSLRLLSQPKDASR